MQFQIPQFIEVEDKIVGPLTLKQFLYLAGAGVFSFILFFLVQPWLWFLLTLILASAGIAAAFGRYNGQPLPRIGFMAFMYFWRPRVYIWQRQPEFRKVETQGKYETGKQVKQGMEKQAGQEAEKQARRYEIPFAVSSIKKLAQELLTRKTPIPKREKLVRIPPWEMEPKEVFQIYRKVTGEKEIARRVDYK